MDMEYNICKDEINHKDFCSRRSCPLFHGIAHFIWNAICMRWKNPFLKQLYLWIICYHYSYQKITVQIFKFDLPVFFCSVYYCSLNLTYRAIKTWMDVSPMPVWCTITNSIMWGSSYFTWVIWLLLCLNSSSEFWLLPIQYFSTCPKYILELKLVSAIFPFFTKW